LLTIEGAFTSLASADLIRSIVDAGQATGSALYQAVAGADAASGEAVSALLVDAIEPGDAEERFPETHDRLMEFALKQELVRLQADMRANESAGDTAAYDELFRRAADVQRRLQDMRATRQSSR
jgi:hypothetical protein